VKNEKIEEEVKRLRSDIKSKREELAQLKQKIKGMKDKIRGDDSKDNRRIDDILGEVSSLIDTSLGVFGVSGKSPRPVYPGQA
jgi:predicted RNase H-like nuclease (RuvC/YqgF family)